MKRLIKFFDKLEDRVRGSLSHHPFIYSLIGGIGVVLFWRGVWNLADDINLSAVSSIIISIAILLPTGLFVSFFIGDNIILTGLRRERKLIEQTEGEIKTEQDELDAIYEKISKIETKLDNLINKTN